MKCRSLLPCIAVSLVVLVCSRAQQSAPASRPDAAFRAAHTAWRVKWQRFTDASMKARQDGRITKGGVLPADVAALQQDADADRERLVRDFGQRTDLGAEALQLLAQVHEAGRDYRAAVVSYERCLAAGERDHPDLAVLHALCIAAMNSKDDAVAARWMRATIAAEDQAGAAAARDLYVRTSYFPRTLIALGSWDALKAHVATLAAHPAPECRTAAKVFGVVGMLHARDTQGAAAVVAEIRKDPAAYPDQQAWAVAVELALRVGQGQFDAGAQLVREFLAQPEPAKVSAVDKNQRRYLAAVAPFLGKPAPAVRVDHWVGGAVAGADALAALRGKVVVLDFWQPWCEPCRHAMPKLIALQKEQGAAVQVLGLCKIEDYGYDVSEKKAVRPIAAVDYPAHVADFRQDMAINYPLAIADTAANNTAYAVAGIPTLVVIDRAGIVRYMSCGAGEPGLFELAMAGVLGAQ